MIVKPSLRNKRLQQTSDLLRVLNNNTVIDAATTCNIQTPVSKRDYHSMLGSTTMTGFNSMAI